MCTLSPPKNAGLSLPIYTGLIMNFASDPTILFDKKNSFSSPPTGDLKPSPSSKITSYLEMTDSVELPSWSRDPDEAFRLLFLSLPV